MSKVNVKNIDSVNFGSLEITTTLNGGFDSSTNDEQKREITLHFVGFDDVDDELKETLLGELAGKLRIKVNQTDGELKGRPGVVDSESYAKMLDENDCEFTFNVAELYEPSSRKLSPEQEFARAAKRMYDDGQISKAKYEQIIEAAKQ